MAAAIKDVIVDQPAARKAAFDGDGGIAMGFDQVLKHAIAKEQDFLAAVEGFAQGKDLNARRQRSKELIDGGIERIARIEGEGDRRARDPVFEDGVWHWEKLSWVTCHLSLVLRHLS